MARRRRLRLDSRAGIRLRTLASALLFVATAFSGAAGESQETGPIKPVASPNQGILRLDLSGNRSFCVEWNEIDTKPGAAKPRQYRNTNLITTFGYKYQISASRKGVAGRVMKLFESQPIRTVDIKEERPPKQFPAPRLATPKDLKRSSGPWVPHKVALWIPGSTCTFVQDSFTFPLDPGRYDLFLGFDLLLPNSQWVPLESDYLTDVLVEKGSVTKVLGRVDYTDGIRTVKLDSAEKPEPTPIP